MDSNAETGYQSWLYLLNWRALHYGQHQIGVQLLPAQHLCQCLIEKGLGLDTLDPVHLNA